MKRFVVLTVAVLLGALVWLATRLGRPESPARHEEEATLATRSEETAPAPAISASERAVVRDEPRPTAPAVDPPAVPASGDPTDEELQRFARELPLGMIEGIVLRGTTPVAGGKAWLGRGTDGGVRWDDRESWETTPNVLRTDIGADGIFRFTDVESDTWALRVRTKDGTARWMWVNLNAGGAPQRIRIVLGTAGIRGRVFEESGAPGGDWRVVAYIFGHMPGDVQQIQDEVATGADGSYAFTELTGGSYIVMAHPAGDLGGPRRREQRVQLAPGEQKVVNFGASRGGVWSGRLTTPRGEPLEIENSPQLEIETDGVSEFVALTGNGRFSKRVAVGKHTASVWQFEGVRTPLGEVTTGEADLEHDLAVPRCLVRVRVDIRGGERTEAWPKGAVYLRLTGKGGAAHEATPWLGGSWVGIRGRDGSFYFFGIPPGEHVLRAGPMPIVGAPDGKMPVTIRPNDDQVEVDVVVSGG